MEAKKQLNLAKRIKAIAETGLVYAQGDYDKDRYTELRAISLELMAQLANSPMTVLNEFFIPQKDYPTPKVDVRAFVLNENNEILMAKERSDGKWTIPGGWSDIGCTPSEVAIKEVQEETGLEVAANRVLAIYDKQRHAHPHEPIYVYKMVFHCLLQGGELKAGFDMLDAAFFPLDRLPELSEIRILESQLQQLHQMVVKDQKEVYFD
ncbi:NUDIX hydrolase [Croceivirga thetidis]|uniref:NUDIX hydrolase n=1 Tax=Croceivirga thetidis TaxID=2721623 RepID=A0ABX1GQV5_9FLAO|nr:NUDIX hydrolase [Croceivirga thetidis]NKI31466.1 NUDIX hydrolase [Croceivirga thetidis]